MNHEVDLKLLTVSGGLFEADGDKKKRQNKRFVVYFKQCIIHINNNVIL